MSAGHSPSVISRLNLSKDPEGIECQLERTSPIRHGTSKFSGCQPEGDSPTASASFKPSDCGFNESEAAAKHCMRQNQRPMPRTSSPIIMRTNTAPLFAEPIDAPNGKQLDGNRCKTLNLVGHESDDIEDDDVFGTFRSTDVKMSLPARKDLRPRSAMDRIKRLFHPHGKKCRDNAKVVGGTAQAKGGKRDTVRMADTVNRWGDQSRQRVGAMIHHNLNKAESDPMGLNAVIERERNRVTDDWEGIDDVRKVRSRNHRTDVIDSAAGHCRHHGWMPTKGRKFGESYPTVEVHSGHDAKVQKGAMLSACLIKTSSTSIADITIPNTALGQEVHSENVLNSETVDNTEGFHRRISPTDGDLCMGRQREVLPAAVRTQDPVPSSSKDLVINPSSEVPAARSLARIQSIENVERWLMHGYQAPRHTKSRQHHGRRNRPNYLCYMSRHRSSISSSEYAISPTDDRHRSAWEHCQSEKDFLGLNDSYHRNENCEESHCDSGNVKSTKAKTSHRLHDMTLLDVDVALHGEEARRRLETVRDAGQNQSDSQSKLNPSLVQFVAELIEGLEKAKHNDSEWSTRFVEQTSTPVLPRVTNLGEESVASNSRKHLCNQSSAEHALSSVFHEPELFQNPNAEEPASSSEGCHVKLPEEVAIYPGTRGVGLNVNSCDRENSSGTLKKSEVLNRPASLSGAIQRCTVERKRTFSLDKLLDDFNSLKSGSRLPPQWNRILPLGRASSPSLLKQCLLQSMEGKSEILSAQKMMSSMAGGEIVVQEEKTEIVHHQPFAQLSADGFLLYADGQQIEYNILQQPDPTEVLEEIRLVAQDAKTLQQNTTEILEHVINIQWKTIRSLQSALSEEQAKRREAERKLEQLTSLPTMQQPN